VYITDSLQAAKTGPPCRRGGGLELRIGAIAFLQIIPDVIARNPPSLYNNTIASVRHVGNRCALVTSSCSKLPSEEPVLLPHAYYRIKQNKNPQLSLITKCPHLVGTLAIAVLLLRRRVANYPPTNPFCCRTPIIA
jgi:hypothetical protein